MKRHQSMVMVFVTLVLVRTVGSGWAADQSQSGQPDQRAPRMMCQECFDAMDTNHRGVVNKDEFMAFRHPGVHGEEVFKSMDTNGNGVLTKDEFCAGKGRGKGWRQ